MKAYKEKHQMKTKPPDCMLCAHCYSEFASDGTTIFCVGRQFSARNGFGPFPVLPKMCPSDFDINIKPLPLTLLPSHIQYLLSIATLAEESAFRQISPMMKLVRMKGNNLARKGVVSLVHQESVLQKILPNLPENCVSCVFTYQSKDSKNSMRSFRCRRWLIQRVLEMFSIIATDIPEWEITVSKDNLHKYPEDGNLLDHAECFVEKQRNEEKPGSKAHDDVLGPAPLQNTDDPIEQFFTCIPTKKV